MKKILFSLMALVCCMSINAQVMKVMKGNEVVATYTADQADRAVFVGPKWVSMGNCTYTDTFVGILFVGASNQTYEVEIEKDLNNEGMYRLVYPYGEQYPSNDPGDWDTSKTYYMEINAVNPDKVYILTQWQGTDWGYGMFAMGSLAGYNVKKGDLEQAEKYYGTLKDGVISFPEGSLLFGMKDYNDCGLYKGGGGDIIVLPGASPKDLLNAKAIGGNAGKSMQQTKKEIKGNLTPFNP